MKRFALVALLIFFFSACSEFQHMHYRKLKKVPAHGIVQSHPATENKPAIEPAPLTQPDTSRIVKTPSSETIARFPAQKKKKYVASPVITKKIIVQKLPQVKKIIAEKVRTKQNNLHKHGKIKSILLLAILLFLGTLAIMFGVLLLANAFYPFSLLVIVTGLSFLFLGFMPFLQLFFLLKKRRYEKMHGPYEERSPQ